MDLIQLVQLNFTMNSMAFRISRRFFGTPLALPMQPLVEAQGQELLECLALEMAEIYGCCWEIYANIYGSLWIFMDFYVHGYMFICGYLIWI
jgi:hypothetical protein